MSWVNPQMAALLRTTPKSLLGKPAETLIAEASLAGFKDLLRTGQRNRGPVGLTFVAADGTEVPAVVTAAKATLEGGVLTCLLVAGHSHDC